MSTDPTLSRRMFLRTALGGAVAIPLLPSLRPAHAGPLARQVRFVAMATQHGAVWGENMWPGDSMLTEDHDIGHIIRRGDLVGTAAGSDTVLSPVLTANSSRLTPAVLEQLNLLRGLDIPFYINHHTGGYLGNYGRNDSEFENPGVVPYHPTIDQIMAWSDGFYGDLSGVVQRSIHIGQQMSWGYANPSNPDPRSIDAMPTTWSAQQVFDSLFGGQEPEGAPRRLVVDKVLASYDNLRNGAFGPGRRLSLGDRDRLDAHMERLYELERRLGAVSDCTDVRGPTEDTAYHPGSYFESFDLPATFAYHQIWNETLALALTCGATRIATYNCLHTYEPYYGDWHQEVAHEGPYNPAAQQHLVDGQRRFFDEVFCDLCQRLDVPSESGDTVLHDSLLMWAQESGPMPHDPISLPVVTAGSAGGSWRTGQYVDYRHRETDVFGPSDPNPVAEAQRPGILYANLLSHICDTMGVDRADWEIPGNPGFGHYHLDWWPAEAWPAYVQDLTAGAMPLLT